MRVVLSDLHFGDRKGRDLLRYEWAQERLWPLLGDADELFLLGDVWDFTFQSYGVAVDTSRPFFNELQARFPRLKVVIVPGNHDHHLVVRGVDERREDLTLDGHAGDPRRVLPAERIVQALAPRLEVYSAYPSWSEDDVWYHHGHYLSSHFDALGWKLLEQVQWKIWGQPRRKGGILEAEYEALISPLDELAYQVAQLPQGVQSQLAWEEQLFKLASVIRFPHHVRNQVQAWTDRDGDRPHTLDGKLMHTRASTSRALEQVISNLGVEESTIVIGHTHESCERFEVAGKQVYNSGSWVFDHRTIAPSGAVAYMPGGALTVERGAVTPHTLLDESQIVTFAWGRERTT
jgi:UDP-2,3-diacylglucosamine pyrophosphatase LpxH